MKKAPPVPVPGMSEEHQHRQPDLNEPASTINLRKGSIPKQWRESGRNRGFNARMELLPPTADHCDTKPAGLEYF